jgi:predicted PurR-regulated permease PerM
MKPKNSPTASESLTFVTIVLAVAALYFGRAVLIPLALAVVFSFLLRPLVTLVEKCRLGRTPAVLLVLVFAFSLVGTLGWVVTEQLMDVTSQLPNYRTNIRNKIESLSPPKDGKLSKAAATVNELNNELTNPHVEVPAGANRNRSDKELGKTVPVRPVPVQVTQPPSNVIQFTRDRLGPLVGPLETAGIVIVFTVFMLMKREDLRNRVIRLAGEQRLNTVTQAMDDASRRLSRYLFLQFLVNAGYGFVFGFALYLIRVPHALLWGVMAGVLRLVPYIGTLCAAIFPVAMALAVFPGWTQAIWIVGIFLILELTISNFIEPWLYGSHTGISSLAILVAAVFWAVLWGPIGLILSTPLTVCLMVLGLYVPQLQFLEVLLGDEPALPPEAQFYQRLLAMDQDEAADIARSYLKEKSLEGLYEAVLIPALGLAEEDRHMGVLEADRKNFICQSAEELVEELGEEANAADKTPDESAMPEADDDRSTEIGSQSRSSESPRLSIVCMPARDRADEIVAAMVAQLLEKDSFSARSLKIGAVADMLDEVSELEASIVCVSALPPFALGHARSLCRRLKTRCPQVRVILGLWNFEGGVARAQDRVGTSSADMVGTALSEVLAEIRQVAKAAASELVPSLLAKGEKQEPARQGPVPA